VIQLWQASQGLKMHAPFLVRTLLNSSHISSEYKCPNASHCIHTVSDFVHTYGLGSGNIITK